jgi:hypothetical protein
MVSAGWWPGAPQQQRQHAIAGRMLALAADLLEANAPEESALFARAAEARTELHAALAEARCDYIGEDPHSSESRLNRFLRRLAGN